MLAAPVYEETLVLPRAVRFPIELLPPSGFDPENLDTWPQVAGRLEYAQGRLLYTPPCSDEQRDTVADVVIALGGWVRRHPEFVLGTNEAGMRIADATRAADAAIWRRNDVGAQLGRVRRHPPVLAVEVSGVDEPEQALREKAHWYLGVGVSVVWLVLPATREVVVLEPGREIRLATHDEIPAHPELPELSVAVRDLFVQISGG